MRVKGLHKAKSRKNDEFYTRLCDVELELKDFKDSFQNKIVYCNADDPYKSNIFRYFYMHFKKLGLKKLIATCYVPTQNDLFLKSENKKAICTEYDGSTKNFTIHELKGNGSFDSPECISFLKQADIVVTNPPFSLLNKYLYTLTHYNKQFIFIAPLTSFGYAIFVKLFQEQKLFVGNKLKDFETPRGAKQIPCHWLNNIKYKNKVLPSTKLYKEDDYRKYDNNVGINIDKISDIPINYYGVMGVPITYMIYHDPKEFAIIKAAPFTLNGRYTYERILIQRILEH